MYTFQATIHARPDDISKVESVALDNGTFQTLHLPPESLQQPMAVSFEEASELLAQLPRMFLEPDGSFVWTSPADEPKWQVDGNLFDRDARLIFVDMNGSCPPAQFDQLLRALGWPQMPLIFQLTRQAVFLDEAEFRRYAESSEFTGRRPME